MNRETERDARNHGTLSGNVSRMPPDDCVTQFTIPTRSVDSRDQALANRGPERLFFGTRREGCLNDVLRGAVVAATAAIEGISSRFGLNDVLRGAVVAASSHRSRQGSPIRSQRCSARSGGCGNRYGRDEIVMLKVSTMFCAERWLRPLEAVRAFVKRSSLNSVCAERWLRHVE
jgi:hypothetical protein